MRKIVQCSIGLLGATVMLWACATPAATQEVSAEAVAAWRPVDAETGQITDIEGLRVLAEAFPDSSSVRLRLLNANLQAGAMTDALADIRWLYDRGYALSAGARGQLMGMFDAGQGAELATLFGSEAAPLAASEAVATLPADVLLPESLVVANDGGDFFVTSVVSRALSTNEGGEWQSLSEPRFGNLTGIAAHETGVWVASGDLGMLPDGEETFSGLYRISIGVREYAAPDGVTLSDIAMGPDFTVYASDPLAGGVYQLRNAASAIEALIPPGTLRSPQGIAPSEDGTRLYVSDYRYGLAIVDTATGAVSRLTADIPVLLDGIDGLWLHEGELIAVQNGINPMRIVALRLSEDGNRITGVRVLERANPEWTEPLGGDVHEGALYYIGNGSWDLFEEGGTLREGAQLRATQVRRLELAENPADSPQ